MQSIASLVMASKVPGVQRLASVLDAFANPSTIPLEDCKILGGHDAWARFFRSGEMSLLNTKRLADFIGCPMHLLMPQPEWHPIETAPKDGTVISTDKGEAHWFHGRWFLAGSWGHAYPTRLFPTRWSPITDPQLQPNSGPSKPNTPDSCSPSTDPAPDSRQHS